MKNAYVEYFLKKKRKYVEIFYLIYWITFGDFYLELLNYHIEMVQNTIRSLSDYLKCNSKSNVKLDLISTYFH